MSDNATVPQFVKLVLIILALAAVLALPIALVNAGSSARPMMSHDFTDVPVAGQEFMEPFINEFYHMGITGGCSTSPLQYCPTNPVTRGSMAVFMGRALGYVDAANEGMPTRAYFKNTGSGWGVVGSSASSYAGILGISEDGYGLQGSSSDSYGVFANSDYASGLYAQSKFLAGPDVISDTIFDVELGGAIGEIHAAGQMNVLSDASVWIDIDNNNDDSAAAFVVFNGADLAMFVVNNLGNVQIANDLLVSGDLMVSGSKSAIVDTVSYGTRAMYAVESPENWFEDFGSAQLVDGEAVITIDPMFAETVNLDLEYHVFTEPVDGWADLYVTEMTATSFTVRSADESDVRFSYRIIAKRLGFEDVRMEEVNPDPATIDSLNSTDRD